MREHEPGGAGEPEPHALDLLARTSVSQRVTGTLAAGDRTVAEVAAPKATVSWALRRLREDRYVVLV